jgi:16S rRNA (cytosine967-C5)-methyltransferase
MPQAPIAPARAAAFHILLKVSASAAHSDDLLHSIAVNALSPEDRNLTTTLVLGVLRWQLYLDTLIKPMLQRADAEIHPVALLALRMGLFQLLYLDRIPAHAALNESVELAKANGAAHAAGMVNALLRRALREKGTERKTLAVKETPAEQAHPQWLITRWRTNFGGGITRRIAEYDQAEPGDRTLFTDNDGVPAIDDGSRLVAELAAASVTTPARILDCCAAPGGKTALLALRHPSAEIVAADINEKRLSAMRRRMDRDPVTERVKTVVVDMTKPEGFDQLGGEFDLILCDAPCSGTGTLARNPEIRHRLRASDLPRQAERQQAILTQSLQLLAPGGRLVYSTCSLEPEENGVVVAKALEAAASIQAIPIETLLHASTSLSDEGRTRLLQTAIHEGALRTLPGTNPCDGFYAVVLERSR